VGVDQSSNPDVNVVFWIDAVDQRQIINIPAILSMNFEMAYRPFAMVERRSDVAFTEGR